MIFQFKTFGTSHPFSCNFLNTCQKKRNNVIQMTKQIKNGICLTLFCQLEGAGQQTITEILSPHVAWYVSLITFKEVRWVDWTLKAWSINFPSRWMWAETLSPLVLLHRNALKAPPSGLPKIMAHDLHYACCSFSSVSCKSDHHTARTNRGFCWSHLTCHVYEQSVISSANLHSGMKKCFSFSLN